MRINVVEGARDELMKITIVGEWFKKSDLTLVVSVAKLSAQDLNDLNSNWVCVRDLMYHTSLKYIKRSKSLAKQEISEIGLTDTWFGNEGVRPWVREDIESEDIIENS